MEVFFVVLIFVTGMLLALGLGVFGTLSRKRHQNNMDRKNK